MKPLTSPRSYDSPGLGSTSRAVGSAISAVGVSRQDGVSPRDATAPERTGPARCGSRRLLVVDDERAILLAMSSYLRAKGYEVDCAREREEAEALLANNDYGCVIVDLRMTPAHGAEGLEIVALTRERCLRTGIVVLTAYGTIATEAEAKARGADLFLSKPQPLGSLAQKVEGLIQEKQR